MSCPAARTCIAVGSAQGTTAGSAQGATGSTLAELWNGATWRVLPAANPVGGAAGALAGVSCRSANHCMAVGYYRRPSGMYLTLIEAWNGTSWIIEHSPSRGIAAELPGVSCPAARRCVAVGGYGALSGTRLTLAAVWNGTRWRLRRLPTS